MTIKIAEAVQGTAATVYRLPGPDAPSGLHVWDLERELCSVTTDSRSVERGSLFIALKGERVDGHDFVAAALESGARACIVSALPAALPEIEDDAPRYLLLAPDTLAALQRLAAFHRSRSPAEVIGITGSVGKTTTKEITASVLSHRWPVLKNVGNLNTEIGLPLTLLGLRADHRAAVLEMGMYAAGDIAFLAGIAAPRIGIVTNVAPVHLERLGTIQRIARAKSELVAALPAHGIAILNGDDPWTRAMAISSGVARAVLVGFAADCEYRAHDVATHGLDGTTFTLRAEGRSVDFQTRIPGAHLVHAFVAAVAVAREMGMEWSEIRDAVEAAELEVRQRLIRVPARGCRPELLIIDDSYNASPLSMNAALELLLASPGSRIAVLGDMLELGPGEEEAHRRVGEKAAQIADWLIVRGPRAGWIAEGALATGFPEDRVRRAPSNLVAAQLILDILRLQVPVAAGSRHTMPSDRPVAVGTSSVRPVSVLVKGSRGMEMEEIVETLRAHHEGTQ